MYNIWHHVQHDASGVSCIFELFNGSRWSKRVDASMEVLAASMKVVESSGDVVEVSTEVAQASVTSMEASTASAETSASMEAGNVGGIYW